MCVKYFYLKTNGSQNMECRLSFPRHDRGTGGGLPIPLWLCSLKQEAWKPFKNPVQVGVDQYWACALLFFVMPTTLPRHTELVVYSLHHWTYEWYKHLSKGSHNHLGTNHYNKSTRKKNSILYFFCIQNVKKFTIFYFLLNEFLVMRHTCTMDSIFTKLTLLHSCF